MPTTPEPSAPTCCPDCGSPVTKAGSGTENYGNRYTGCGRTWYESTAQWGSRTLTCLAAQVAALRADVARLEGERANANGKYEALFQQNCELNHRIEVEDADVIQRLESALASSVPRAVAERACEQLLESAYDEFGTKAIPGFRREQWKRGAAVAIDRALAEHDAARQREKSDAER